MDANVVARMNGGVSSTVGRTVDGIVMMWWLWMKPISVSNVERKVSSSLSGRG